MGTKHGRLIDADALIDKFGDWYTEEGTEEGYIGTIKGVVDSMPTIEPERKKGRWIRYAECDCLKCDQCGMPSINAQNFCCGCGADMRGERDE